MTKPAVPNRRQVLRGAGGFTLALPLLPSLLSRQARAAATAQPRMFWLTSGHGGAYESNMFPSQSLLTGSADIFTDQKVRWGQLKTTSDGMDAVLSPILRAKATTFTPKLLGKMNVLYGLDVPFYISHNTGLHLGNYARNDGNSADSGGVVQKMPRPTIDQVMGWSSTFYPSLTGIRERVMVMGGPQVSWNYSNPGAQSGTIQAASSTGSSIDLFTRVFTPGQTPTQMMQRPPIADRVLQNYKSLRESNRRLSAADKLRLDNHVAALDELQRKLTTTAAPMCNNLTKPGDDANKYEGDGPVAYARRGQLFNDVVAAAFACGASRIGVFSLSDEARAVSYTGSWHQDVAHNWGQPERQALLARAYQVIFEGIFLDLAAKLDAITDGDGKSVLDNTLMAWSQECGMSTHDSASIPVVTFGSARGWFKTGNLVDFRRVGNPKSAFGTDAMDPTNPGQKFTMYQGLLYNQWLATVLQSMGLPPAEWERWGHKGYGVPFVSPEGWLTVYKNHYTDTNSRYFTMASDPLPFIKA